MSHKELFNTIGEEPEQQQHDYRGPHCCLNMDSELSISKAILHYSSVFREYGINIPQSTGCMLMDFCMFCGKKLPLSVRDEWYDILEHEYGLESPDEDDRKRVPKEFLIDEWWKKRAL